VGQALRSWPLEAEISDAGLQELKNKKSPWIPWAFSFFGGNGGIRTLDEALHPILP
jgi:hypothetical protein